MKLAVHLMAYNVSRFLESVINNMEPFVDRIYVVYATRPFNYNKEARINRENPTTLAEVERFSGFKKVKIVMLESTDEFTPRNECLRLAREEGFDWLLTQDADEFYTEESWSQIKKELLQNKSTDHYATTWYNFWKSSHYVLVEPNIGMKQANINFAIRCKSDLKFIGTRRTNAEWTKIIDSPCFHYGYVMSDDEMLEKINTWAHTSEVNVKQWFEIKWLNWQETTRHLNPVNPLSWRRAIRFPCQQPPFAEEFNLPIKYLNSNSLPNNIRNWLYDTKVSAQHCLKRAHALVLK